MTSAKAVEVIAELGVSSSPFLSFSVHNYPFRVGCGDRNRTCSSAQRKLYVTITPPRNRSVRLVSAIPTGKPARTGNTAARTCLAMPGTKMVTRTWKTLSRGSVFRSLYGAAVGSGIYSVPNTFCILRGTL